MSFDLEGNDDVDWKREGLSRKEQVESVVQEIKEFYHKEVLLKDDIEEMSDNLDDWEDRYGDIDLLPLQLKFDEAVTKCRVRMAGEYLDLFLALPEPRAQECRTALNFINYLKESNHTDLLLRKVPNEDLESAIGELMAKIDQVHMTAASHHPDVLQADAEMDE